jgi:ornithine cyclodeaminase/alanine dehydrogenase-like protein (mu-crystallin family)
VDGIEHVLHRETPVIALMIEQGKIRREDILEMGAIVCGEQPGRSNAEERVFFSPIGLAIEDLCLCHKVYKLAQENSIGTTMGMLGREV